MLATRILEDRKQRRVYASLWVNVQRSNLPGRCLSVCVYECPPPSMCICLVVCVRVYICLCLCICLSGLRLIRSVCFGLPWATKETYVNLANRCVSLEGVSCCGIHAAGVKFVLEILSPPFPHLSFSSSTTIATISSSSYSLFFFSNNYCLGYFMLDQTVPMSCKNISSCVLNTKFALEEKRHITSCSLFKSR